MLVDHWSHHLIVIVQDVLLSIRRLVTPLPAQKPSLLALSVGRFTSNNWMQTMEDQGTLRDQRYVGKSAYHTAKQEPQATCEAGDL